MRPSITRESFFLVQIICFIFPILTNANDQKPPKKGPQAESCEITVSVPGTSPESGISAQVVKKTEYIFTQVSHLKAGIGWRDPSGLVWYGRAAEDMTWKKADRYCRDLGLRLPTIEEFEQLGQYLGASRDGNGNYNYTGYHRGVLPDLQYNDFWSSTPTPYFPNERLGFDGSFGSIVNLGIQDDENYSVRCVGSH